MNPFELWFNENSQSTKYRESVFDKYRDVLENRKLSNKIKKVFLEGNYSLRARALTVITTIGMMREDYK